MVTPWWLVDIAYFAILNSNDHIASIADDNDFMNIYKSYLLFDEDRTKRTLGDDPAAANLFTYMLGLSEKTFWYQEPFKIRSRLNRDVELLDVIAPAMGSQINVNSIMTSATGFTAVQFRRLIFALFAVSLKQVDLTTITEDGTAGRLDPILTSDNLEKVVRFYSADYQEYRTSKLGENHFIIKPIIRTSKNCFIALSAFLLSRKLYDEVFWIIRDYYINSTHDKKQIFTNEFGLIFEKYIEKLLAHFLPPGSYHRIPAYGTKHADWIISSPRYTVLVEQKSSLMSLMLRTPYMDNRMLQEYQSRLVEALLQLDNSESVLCRKDARNPKLVLFFDEIQMLENIMRPRIIDLAKDKLLNPKDYFFINISDFEHLVQVLGEQPDTFDRIMDSKIATPLPPTLEGLDFFQVIPRFYTERNLYANEVINHYESYLGFDGRLSVQGII